MKKLLTLLTIALSLVIINHSCKPKEEEPEPGSIYGVVTDKATGEPVKTAGVELQPLGLKTVTGSEGQFEFNELEAGDYKLFVTKTGYVELVSNTIVVKSAQIAKGDVQIEKLPAALKVVDDKGEEISELDFGNQYDDVSRMFSIFNDGPELLNYEIVKTAAWITSLSATEGSLEPGATKPIVVNIDREKLQVGENTTTLHITSNNGSKQLTIHVEKLPTALSVVDKENKSIDELDFGNNPTETSRTFYLYNNAKPSLNYQITKDVEWISSISSTQGTIEGNAKVSIVVLINRDKLSIGENITTLNIQSDNGGKQLTVKANKLAPELMLVDDNGKEITEVNYGSNFDNLSRSFNVFNNGTTPLDYQINESAEWLTVSNQGGTIQGGVKVPITITIDLNKLAVGENSSIINVTSEYGNKQLTVKANKLAPELVILNDAGNEITEIDYASNFDNLSRTFNIKNNGVVSLNYQISKSVDWLTLSNESGSLNSKETKPIFITIDINKLPIGENSTLLNISSEYGNKQLAVKANKLAPELVILNDAGDEITEIDYASNFDNLSRQFNIRNNGIVALSYQISKTVDWLTINNTEGMLQAGAMSSVVITIDINKLPVGSNTAMLSINSEYGNKQLAVKANKLAPELVILNDAGNEITEIDYASNFDNLSRQFNIRNNGIVALNYQISKTVDWLTINNTEGMLQAGAMSSVVITIDINKLPVGNNTAMLSINSEYDNKQLAVKANKLAPELVITDIIGNNLSDIDFGKLSYDNIPSETIKITNNGVVALNYEIIKSVEWINFSNYNGMLPAGTSANVIMELNVDKMVTGENVTTINIGSEYGDKQITISVEKKTESLNANLHYAFTNTSTTQTFNLRNNSYKTTNYQITKTADWIVNITNNEGVLLPNESKSVTVTINPDIVPLGNSTEYIIITSDFYEDLSLKVKCVIDGEVLTRYSEDDFNSVTLYGEIQGDFSYSERGFYFGTDENCTTKYIVAGNGTGEYSYYVSGLEEGMEYYYKAYVVRNNITITGTVKTGITRAHTFIAEGCGPGGCDLIVDMVDLGEYTWSTTNTLTNANSEVDGMINMDILKNIDPTLNQFPAAKACAMKGEGWYLPSKAELHNILEKYLDYHNHHSAFYSGSYWSSTEKDTDNSYGCKVGKFSNGDLYHNDNSASGIKTGVLKVRAVKRAN